MLPMLAVPSSTCLPRTRAQLLMLHRELLQRNGLHGPPVNASRVALAAKVVNIGKREELHIRCAVCSGRLGLHNLALLRTILRHGLGDLVKQVPLVGSRSAAAWCSPWRVLRQSASPLCQAPAHASLHHRSQGTGHHVRRLASGV